jgi:hypothetical protein
MAMLQRQHIFRFAQARRAAIFDCETRGFCMITFCIHHLEEKIDPPCRVGQDASLGVSYVIF